MYRGIIELKNDTSILWKSGLFANNTCCGLSALLIKTKIFVVVALQITGPILERKSVWGSDVSLKSALFEKKTFGLNQKSQKQLPVREDSTSTSFSG